ncbi:MAG TPA: bifunctional 3-deoxy-7-phosphoheptulonate synthase/chorismate mutase type II [Bacteroidales bacterium]|nr:bifunctional 3-deoxy-7-phosphoheptulonate synthase/chorismate mutase type II [Bacteroidales bacterium]
MDILPLTSWLENYNQPLIISGPCSAETEEQVLATAKELAKIKQVKIFRAGIWKPRTRPSQFEGVGSKGLDWLKRVRQETGLLTAVEVATPQHVVEAIESGVDILWIGARTVVNPFSVQEIADSLQGVDIPVMIKNPVNPDLKLWMGTIERCYRAGIRKIIAVHRGFFYFEKTPYRNAPMWEIPIELKRLIPNLPIICDPSHICGKMELIYNIAQKALDLEMDGLMVEVHDHPEKALTDARQQITPYQLSELLTKLVIRKTSGSHEFENKLEELRREIDKLDDELITILSRRMEIVKEIGEYKKENDITILQIKRWSEIIRYRLENASRAGLDRDFLIRLFELVHKEAIQIQSEIMEKGKLPDR